MALAQAAFQVVTVEGWYQRGTAHPALCLGSYNFPRIYGFLPLVHESSGKGKGAVASCSVTLRIVQTCSQEMSVGQVLLEEKFKIGWMISIKLLQIFWWSNCRIPCNTHTSSFLRTAVHCLQYIPWYINFRLWSVRFKTCRVFCK